MEIAWARGGPHSLRVGSYNVLMKDVPNAWHPRTDPAQLEWKYREPLLRKAIADMNVDVLCLQEVHAIAGKTVFDDLLTELGYEFRCCARLKDDASVPAYCTFVVVLAVRVSNPRVRVRRWVYQSFAKTMSKISQTASAEAFKAQLGDHQVALGCEITVDEQSIAVIGTHLVNAVEERFRQVTQLGLLEMTLPVGAPAIVMGDFNFVPQTECYDLLSTGSVKSVGGVPLALFEAKYKPLRSAYAALNGREPEMTNYVKKPETFIGTIDYVFFSEPSRLEVVDCLKMPSSDDVTRRHEEGFPNEFYPSDHIPIGAAFTITPHDAGADGVPKESAFGPYWEDLTANITLAEEPKVFPHLTDEHRHPHDKTLSIYVLDLPDTMVTHKNHVRHYFSNFGTVQHVHIRHNPATGEPSNTAFVSFSSAKEAAAVIEQSKLAKLVLNGQRIKAFPKK